MFGIVSLEQQSGDVKSDSGSGPYVGTRRMLPRLEDLCSPAEAHVKGGEGTSKDNPGRCTLAHSLCRSHDPHSVVFVLPACALFRSRIPPECEGACGIPGARVAMAQSQLYATLVNRPHLTPSPTSASPPCSQSVCIWPLLFVFEPLVRWSWAFPGLPVVPPWRWVSSIPHPSTCQVVHTALVTIRCFGCSEITGANAQLPEEEENYSPRQLAGFPSLQWEPVAGLEMALELGLQFGMMAQHAEYSVMEVSFISEEGGRFLSRDRCKQSWVFGS